MRSPKICIVTGDILGPVVNGGIGTAKSFLGQALARAGFEVDLLFVHECFYHQNTLFDIWKREYEQLGINFISHLSEFSRVEDGKMFKTFSYYAFERLKDENYDAIIFPEMGCLGFYCLEAKRLGTHFKNTKLITMFHGPTEWHQFYNNEKKCSVNDLMLFHMERHSCLNSDHIFFATNHAKKIAEDWNYLGADVSNDVILYPYGSNIKNALSADKISEICFFGRLETRKGLEIFLDSLILLGRSVDLRNVKISALGRFGKVNSSECAKKYIKKWSKISGINIEVKSKYNQKEAISYLRKNNCLAIVPSIDETLGYTLIECLVNGVPFICSDISSFKEVLDHFNVESPSVFSSGSSIELAAQIEKGLANPSIPKVEPNAEKIENDWVSSFRRLLNKKNNIISKSKLPTLSICITHRERPQFLSQLIKSLQPVLPVAEEILVFDNDSSSLEAKKYLKSLESDFLSVVFHKNNSGPSYARNMMARKAKGDYILFLDDDNKLIPKTFLKIWHSMPPDTGIVCSPLARFKNDSTEEVDLNRIWLPVGNGLSFNICDNQVGDGNFLVSRSKYLELGGMNEKMHLGEDQEFFIRSAIGGINYNLSPEPFVKYRIHKGNNFIPSKREKIKKEITKNLKCSFVHSNRGDLYNLVVSSYGKKMEIDYTKPFYEFIKFNGRTRKQLADKDNLVKTNSQERLSFVRNFISNKTSWVGDSLKVEFDDTAEMEKSAFEGDSRLRHSVKLTLYSREEGVIAVNEELVKLNEGLTRLQIDMKKHPVLHFESLKMGCGMYLVECKQSL